MEERVVIFLLAGLDMPCRLMHTFIWALDIDQRGGEAKIVIEGEAPHWLPKLADPEHGKHPIYKRVKEKGLIDAVCKACAIQARALEVASEEGLRIVADASGHVSLAPYMEAGYRVVML